MSRGRRRAPARGWSRRRYRACPLLRREKAQAADPSRPCRRPPKRRRRRAHTTGLPRRRRSTSSAEGGRLLRLTVGKAINLKDFVDEETDLFIPTEIGQKDARLSIEGHVGQAKTPPQIEDGHESTAHAHDAHHGAWGARYLGDRR